MANDPIARRARMLALIAARFARFAGQLPKVAIGRGRKSALAHSGHPFEPRRLTLEDQWNAIVRIISGATSGVAIASACHASAALQLDLAQYGLVTLAEELSAVMTLPGRRRPATVHVLEPAPTRPFGQAIAA